MDNIRWKWALAKFIESHDVEGVEGVHLEASDLELGGALWVHVVKLVTLAPRPLPPEPEELLEAAVEARLPGQADGVVACAEHGEALRHLRLWGRDKDDLVAAGAPDVGGLHEKSKC